MRPKRKASVGDGVGSSIQTRLFRTSASCADGGTSGIGVKWAEREVSWITPTSEHSRKDTFHLGRRTVAGTLAFTHKLDYATRGHFQVSTDGFGPYRDAFGVIIGHRTDFARIVKVFGTPTADEYLFCTPEVIEMIKTTVHGRPDLDKATMSHVQRQNLTIRMNMRRFTRLTNGFSKKWLNLYEMLCLHYANYNFCRVHQSIRGTPAMEAGITDHVWTLKELVN